MRVAVKVFGAVALFFVGLSWSGCVSYPGTPVTSQMTSDEFLQKFMKENCGYGWEEKEKQPEARRKECSQKWAVAFGQTLQKNYRGVVLEDLLKKCETFSRTCDPGNLERWAQDAESEAPAAVPTPAPAEVPPCKRLKTPCD
jgi:hypothetical protein